MASVVVTGISRGIGRAVAERFAQSGWQVLGSASSEASLAPVRAAHPDWQLHPADLANRAQLDAFAQFVLGCLGTAPDVLVNNAGRFLPGAIHEEAEGTLDAMLATNLASAYHLTRALLPGMMARRSGSIVNMCSTASLMAYPNGGSYGISKFALLGMTKTLRAELRPYGVRAIAVLPGATYTDSWAGAGLPAERFMQPADVGEAVFLACTLPAATVVEEILLRPQLGDI